MVVSPVVLGWPKQRTLTDILNCRITPDGEPMLDSREDLDVVERLILDKDVLCASTRLDRKCMVIFFAIYQLGIISESAGHTWTRKK